jgi:hypothetical protein
MLRAWMQSEEDGEGWDGMKRKAPAGHHLPPRNPGPCGATVGLICAHW